MSIDKVLCNVPVQFLLHHSDQTVLIRTFCAMGSRISNQEIVRPEVADMYAVHNLESSDFVCLPDATESLLEYVRKGAEDRPVEGEGKEGGTKCLQFIVRHFIDISLGTGNEGASVPESCLVSVGVIKGNRVLALELDKGRDTPFTSRPRKCDRDVVFCWFISVATVQLRCCLLTRLTLGDLSTASSAKVVERISHGDLGYYVCRRSEERLIHRVADISFSFASDELSFCRRREVDEEPWLALFCAKSGILEMATYHGRFAVAFMCSQWDFEQVGAKAFGDLAAVTPLGVDQMRHFCHSCATGVLPIIIIDVDYLGTEKVGKFLLEFVESSFERHEFRPEVVAFYGRTSLMGPLACANTVLGPMTIPLLQSSVLTSIIRQGLCGRS